MTAQMGPPPLKSLAAEEALAAGILLYGPSWSFNIVDDDDLFYDGPRAIVSAARQLHTAGLAVTVSTVIRYLDKYLDGVQGSGSWGWMHGEPYIMDLANRYLGTEDSLCVEVNAAIVKDLAERRRKHGEAQHLIHEAYDGIEGVPQLEVAKGKYEGTL